MDYKDKIIRLLETLDSELDQKFLRQIFLMIRRHKMREQPLG